VYATLPLDAKARTRLSEVPKSNDGIKAFQVQAPTFIDIIISKQAMDFGIGKEHITRYDLFSAVWGRPVQSHPIIGSPLYRPNLDSMGTSGEYRLSLDIVAPPLRQQLTIQEKRCLWAWIQAHSVVAVPRQENGALPDHAKRVGEEGWA
jgi:hypothetical protein